jgi:stage II sporulation protein P
MKKFALAFAFMIAVSSFFVPVTAVAAGVLDEGATDGDCIYSLYSEDGEFLTVRAARMYVDDEYIAGDNRHFQITRVDDATCTAYGKYLGIEEAEAVTLDEAQAAFAALAATTGTKTIAMYSTHSDESYVPTDGTASKLKNAGIYDVGESFKKALEGKGINVTYSQKTFFPHDTGAYSRSRSTAEELLKKSPDALFDIHRDAVPASQYDTKVGGTEMSKVRLFVGKRNQNSDANKSFAKTIKATADKKYPGLVKDIYMGKGNYNQELYPKALLFEFGTHEIDKDLVLTSTKYMADVVNTVLYGEGAQAAGQQQANQKQSSKGSWKGIAWVVGIAIVAAALFAIFQTGRFGDAWNKLKHSTSELTGGSAGKRNKK